MIIHFTDVLCNCLDLVSVNECLEYPIQEERIMQSLNIINIALVRDQECRKKNLQIRTVDVSFYQFFYSIKDDHLRNANAFLV